MIALTALKVEAQLFLAEPQPGDYDPATGKGPEWGKAAPVALLVILLMAIALYFLIKSMSRQLKKVPPTFDDATVVAADPVAESAGADGSDEAAGAAEEVADLDAPGLRKRPHTRK